MFWQKLIKNITVARALYTFLVMLFIGVFIPPTLMHVGAESVARPFYTAYGFLCHQIPERSFFLYGQQTTYKSETLANYGYSEEIIFNPSARYIGDEAIGYKVAVCARDFGLYMGLLIGGFVAMRAANPVERYNLKVKRGLVYFTGIPLLVFIFLLLPMILDGGLQFVAYLVDFDNPFYQSNNLKRIVTGLLFGGGVGFWAFAVLKYNEAITKSDDK